MRFAGVNLCPALCVSRGFSEFPEGRICSGKFNCELMRVAACFPPPLHRPRPLDPSGLQVC